ncbi:MAG: nitrogenase iron-molybdenum cofactor biosynthesis protein NifE, partial [Firmicutes bacterium]|nr:nitrogenase iron-molybdenum cofactor biosynthesis protein NifE [Bacillota bacterium]
MLPSQLFYEPACSHQRKKAPGQRCALPKPGSASGGCAFDGAQIVGVPLADVAHLVHGPIACLGNSWDVRGALSSGPTLYRTAFTTDLDESGIVFGGEKRLLAAIREVVHRYHPPAVMVYATCVTALIGDDLEEACRSAQAELGIPVIPVNAPGFLGSKNLGNRATGQALLDHVIGTREPAGDTSRAVNLIGDYNIAGELWNITPLL